MNKTSRINGFDALRTIAMWLGIVLHGIILYKVTPEVNWPKDPSFNTRVYDWLYHFIHSFRMPLFFMVAGFFAHMVINRSGKKYFISQRIKRIGVPFVLGVLILVPLTLWPFHYYNFHHVQQFPVDAAIKKSTSQMLKWNGLAHLWFLYYLLFFYFGSVIVSKLALGFIPSSTKREGNLSWLTLLLGTIVFVIILLVFRIESPEVYTGIKPDLIYICYYGFFYVAGWLMQPHPGAIRSLAAKSWPLFLFGLFLSCIFLLNARLGKEVIFILAAFQTITLTAGITGIFIRHFNKASKTWRYLSDAAYWVYLVHLIIVSSLQVFMLSTNIPGWLRFPIILVVTVTLSLLTYHYLVRYTVIGTFLHGRREKDKIMVNQNPAVSL
ncbi:MAG: acyltransferase family protein [Flavisolibacter sp.]